MNKPKHGMSSSRIYKIWAGIKYRCKSNNKNYGGRGITYDTKRENFEGFYDDMKAGYNKNLTIDRINNDGNYCKENCRRATIKEQSLNTSRSSFLEYKGDRRTLKEWSDEIGIKYGTLAHRVKSGREPEDILFIREGRKPNNSYEYKNKIYTAKELSAKLKKPLGTIYRRASIGKIVQVN